MILLISEAFISMFLVFIEICCIFFTAFIARDFLMDFNVSYRLASEIGVSKFIISSVLGNLKAIGLP